MSRPPLPAALVELLRRPNAAVMATVRSDGAPVTAATWYVWEDDGRVLVNLDESRVRLKHLQNDPRVSLTVLDENWYTHVTLIGRVTELRADEGELMRLLRVGAEKAREASAPTLEAMYDRMGFVLP